MEQPPVSPSKLKSEEVKPELAVQNKYRSAIVEGDFEFVSTKECSDVIVLKLYREFILLFFHLFSLSS